MSDTVTLQVQKRTTLGKAVRRLRQTGKLPANIFGGGRDSLPVQVDARAFERFLATHPGTTVLELDVDNGAGETAIVRRVQHEPVTGGIQHVDFMRVEMSKPIRARVPVRVVGQAPAEKLVDGLPLQLLESVEVEALPGDLPVALDVDISDMTELNATHSVSDLRVPRGVKVLTDTDEPVIKIEPPRIAVEEVAPAASEEETAERAEEAPSAEGEETSE